MTDYDTHITKMARTLGITRQHAIYKVARMLGITCRQVIDAEAEEAAAANGQAADEPTAAQKQLTADQRAAKIICMLINHRLKHG